MSDGWSDRKNHSICNFLVNNPKGTIFFSISGHVWHYQDEGTRVCNARWIRGKDRGRKFVQVVTNNVASYKVVG